MQEIDVYPAGERVDEFEGKPVHVCHREDGHEFLAGCVAHLVESVAEVRPHTAVGQHYALGRAGCPGGIVYHRQFIGMFHPVVHVP